MRSCGFGYSGIKRFTSFVNIPPPMTINNFDKITKQCKVASNKITEKSMQDGAKEIRIIKGDANGIVWERVPKTRYVALEKLEFGFYE